LKGDTPPAFFATPSAFRAWFEQNHENETELWVGFYRRKANRPSITWSEAVDEALCFGWIDGVRRGVDESAYAIRFTPRRPRSTWSRVNINRASELATLGRMRPAGLRAFEQRSDERSGTYSYEHGRAVATLDAAQEQRFRTNAGAWEFFSSQSPSYRQTVTGWVISAKREETKNKRLQRLIEESARGRRIPPLDRQPPA
jgi:uncharacterized protein YdeI (YjbR/CyaY-like superfamily)